MRSKVLVRSLCALMLAAFCAMPGQSQVPVDPQIGKEIADLEARLLKLQEKLKALKDQATQAPGKSAEGQKVPGYLDKLLTWRSIGPANMGGRITGLAVFEADPTCYYVATA